MAPKTKVIQDDEVRGIRVRAAGGNPERDFDNVDNREKFRSLDAETLGLGTDSAEGEPIGVEIIAAAIVELFRRHEAN